MALSIHSSRTAISTRHFAGYLWNTTWCPERTIITDGFRDLWCHGGSDGDALYVFNGGVMVDLDRSIRSHDAAVAYCTEHFDELVNGKAVAA